MGCIDHHDDEGKIPPSQVEEMHIIRPCGSCTSLVVEYCKSAWQSLSSSQEDETKAQDTKLWDSQVARVALAPVLIDTVNLTAKEKTKPTDTATAAFLNDIIASTGDSTFSSDEYFHTVSAAKENLDPLPLPDILRKDYKQWSESQPDSSAAIEIGIGSVVKNVQYLIDKASSKDEFFKTVEEFSKQRKLSIEGIMTTSHNGHFTRELLIWAFDEKGIETAKRFESEAGEQLGLKPLRNGELDSTASGLWRKCWVQEEVKYSRKKVAPLLRGAVRK